jgi:cytochrome P450
MSTVFGKRGSAQGGCPVTGMGRDFDPFATDPYPLLHRAREEEPVFYSPEVGYWVVTRLEDVIEVLRDAETYSARIALEPIAPLCPAAKEVMEEYGVDTSPNPPSLVEMDPPVHRVARQSAKPSFSLERVDKLEPIAAQLVEESIDGIIGRGEADLVREVFWPVPCGVIFEMMGIPASELVNVKENTARVALLGWGMPDEEEQIELARGLGEYWQLADAHVDRLLAGDLGEGNLFNDIIKMARATGMDQLLERGNLCWTFINMLLAGHETTTNASASAFQMLLTHRDQWEALCDDPTLIPNAVEECLRYASSVPNWRRVTTKPTTLGGVDLPEGARLLVGLGSANHDDARFPDGERFDIRRENARQHLAFSWGRHLCLGAPLARMEMRVLLEKLTRRLPHMELVPDQEWSYPRNVSFRGPEHVLVRWNPAENPLEADRS